MDENKKIIEQFFGKGYTGRQALRIYRLFGAKGFDRQVLGYLEEEWRNFEPSERRLPPDFDRLYAKTAKKSGIISHLTLDLLKIAALLICMSAVFLVAYNLLNHHNHAENVLAYEEATTQRGETKSKIRYPKTLSEMHRNIYIDGAAYFKLSAQTKPLKIFADEISAEVSGASFNISAYPDGDDITIAVENGGTIKTTAPILTLTPALPAKEAGSVQSDIDLGHPMQTRIVHTNECFSYNKAANSGEHKNHSLNAIFKPIRGKYTC